MCPTLVHARVAIIAVLTDSGQSRTLLLLWFVCHDSAQAHPMMLKHLPGCVVVWSLSLRSTALKAVGIVTLLL